MRRRSWKKTVGSGGSAGRARAIAALKALSPQRGEQPSAFLVKFTEALARRDRRRFHGVAGHVRQSDRPVLYSERARTKTIARNVAVANAEAIALGAASAAPPEAGTLVPGMMQPIALATVERQAAAAARQPAWALAAQRRIHRGPAAPSKVEGVAIGLALAMLFNVLLVQVVLPTLAEGGGGKDDDYEGGEMQSLTSRDAGGGISLRAALSGLQDADFTGGGGDGYSPRSRLAEKKRLSVIMEASDVSDNTDTEPASPGMVRPIDLSEEV